MVVFGNTTYLKKSAGEHIPVVFCSHRVGKIATQARNFELGKHRPISMLDFLMSPVGLLRCPIISWIYPWGTSTKIACSAQVQVLVLSHEKVHKVHHYNIYGGSLFPPYSTESSWKWSKKPAPQKKNVSSSPRHIAFIAFLLAEQPCGEVSVESLFFPLEYVFSMFFGGDVPPFAKVPIGNPCSFLGKFVPENAPVFALKKASVSRANLPFIDDFPITNGISQPCLLTKGYIANHRS